MTTWFAVTMFFLAGLVGAYRTRRAAIGPLVAIAASMIGNAAALMATVVLFFTMIHRDSQMLRTFEMTGGWDEALFLPIVLVPIVAAIGLAGGLVASLAERVNARAS
jgi:phosphatidylglycerophosphate synthase